MSVYQPRAFVRATIGGDGAPDPRLSVRDPDHRARAGEPQISHLPLLLHASPSRTAALIGHMARANPHWRHFADGATLAMFHGPHAYVSPSWYAEPAKPVPTWNYAVVHVHGRVELVEDRAATLAILHEMVERFEAGRAAPWRLQLEGARLDAMVGAIVAFRLEIERVDAKFKLSQNGTKRDRQTGRRGAARAKTPPTQAPPPTGCSVMPEAIDPARAARVRFDKWLWAARFYKTRSLAAQAIEAGRARVDDQRVKPSHVAATGERIVLRKDAWSGRSWWSPVSDKRGTASEAAKLYRESPESIAARGRRNREPQSRRAARRATRLAARPSATDANSIRFSKKAERHELAQSSRIG